jgi:hypothetical protein
MSIRTTLELLHSRYLDAVTATPSLPSTWDVLFRRSFSLVEVTFDWLKSSYFSCHFADSEVECACWGYILPLPPSITLSLLQWRAGYYFSGGASWLSTSMRPYNLTLGKRGPKARVERHRCEVFLGCPGECPPGKFLNLESLKCHFLDFGEDLTEIWWLGNGIITCRNLKFG